MGLHADLNINGSVYIKSFYVFSPFELKFITGLESARKTWCLGPPDAPAVRPGGNSPSAGNGLLSKPYNKCLPVAAEPNMIHALCMILPPLHSQTWSMLSALLPAGGRPGGCNSWVILLLQLSGWYLTLIKSCLEKALGVEAKTPAPYPRLMPVLILWLFSAITISLFFLPPGWQWRIKETSISNTVREAQRRIACQWCWARLNTIFHTDIQNRWNCNTSHANLAHVLWICNLIGIRW